MAVTVRSVSAGIQTWLSTIAAQISAGLGIAVGQGALSFAAVYNWAMAVNLALVAPLGLLVVGSRPPKPNGHFRGCCTPEPAIVEDPSAVERRGQPCCQRSASAALHFFDALRYRPYFWLAAVAVLQTVWSNLQGLYYFYWFEDVIAPDFDAFGHRLTNSTATAIAINSAAGSLGSFIFAIPGGFIGDRLGRHAVLLSTGYAT